MILRLEPFSGKIAGSSDGFLDDTFILTTSRNPVNNDIAESLGKLGNLASASSAAFLRSATSPEIVLVRDSNSAFSSPDALAIRLPSPFCSARRFSWAKFADQPHQSRLGGITAILRVVKHRLTTEKSPNTNAVEASYQTALRVPRLN